MKNYQDYLNTILKQGTWQSNRTGIDCISVPGAMMQFNMDDGFPAVTIKRLFFGAVKGELIGFLRGYDSAEQFRALGCKIWDQNANENADWLANPNRKGEDDLGRVYGVQWRNWRANGSGEGGSIDQVQIAIDTILKDPQSRRIIVSAWRPDEFNQMALPPCHVLSQYLVDTSNGRLNMCLYQRSGDSALGIPFNIASYALLLHIVAQITGLTPGTLTHFVGDAHIYQNHLEGVYSMLLKEPKRKPVLTYTGPDLKLMYEALGMEVFNLLDPNWWVLEGYECHEAVAFAMAV